jgi:hypothetical protein
MEDMEGLAVAVAVQVTADMVAAAEGIPAVAVATTALEDAGVPVVREVHIRMWGSTG